MNQYDLGARFYDPVVGRFSVIDAFTDFSADLTSYRYAFDNPVSFTDPTGLFEEEGGGYGYNDEGGDNPKMIYYTTGIVDNNKEDDDEKYHYVLRPTENVDELDVSRGTDYNDGSSTELESREIDVEEGEGDDQGSEGKASIGIGLTVGQIAFNEIAVPIMLTEPTPFGEAFVAVVNIGFMVFNMSEKMKGERNKTSKASGTDSPFKKLKPDPNKPGNVLVKDSHTGKTVSKKAPDGFDEWWKNKDR